MGSDKWLDVSAWFTSEINYVIDYLELKVRTINQISN